MNKKFYLQTLENNLNRENDFKNIYFNDYLSPITIDRDGIFFSLFNKVIDPLFDKLPHLILSRFEAFKDHLQYYKINNLNEFKLNKDSTIIILFHLSPHLQPLELVKDFLENFKDYFLSNSAKTKVVAHYHYHLDLEKTQDQNYLLSYFQLVEKFLGALPDELGVVEIEKMASFENFLIIEAGTQWSCLDNYLVHVVLSKGGYLQQLQVDESKFEILTESPLSPYHSIQIMKKLPGSDFDIACPFLDDLKSRDFFKHPGELNLFYYLIYKNLFKIN